MKFIVFKDAQKVDEKVVLLVEISSISYAFRRMAALVIGVISSQVTNNFCSFF